MKACTICVFSLLIFIVNSQPLADSKSGYINFFMEMLNPSFRQHRARIRPFSNQYGTPVINVRGARDTSNILKSFLKPECVYSPESLICVGMDINGNKTSVECEAKFNVNLNLNSYSIGDLRVWSEKDQLPIAKFNIYPKINSSTWLNYKLNNSDILTIHLDQEVADKGLSILDKNCWMKLIKFFMTTPVYDEIKIKKQNLTIISDLKILF